MDACIATTSPPTRLQDTREESLELGELLAFDTCLFPLPSLDDQAFLRTQRLFHAKEIAYDPGRDVLTGHVRAGRAQNQRLQRILAESLWEARRWISHYLPHYGEGIVPLRVCFHPDEEATRCLRPMARNDLLHIDALRPVDGARVLRLGINLNPLDPRVWATSESLLKVMPVHGPRCGLVLPPPLAWPYRMGRNVLGLVRPHRPAKSPYDDFMIGFANYLKLCEEFQDKAPRKIWRFGPQSAWLACTDGLVHAELRGRWVLDHIFLIPESLWTRPEAAPLTLLKHLGVSLSPSRRAA